MIKKICFTTLYLIGLLLACTHGAQASQPVVQAVLFYSPTCSHCQKVISQDLPPIQAKYGSQFQIAHINVTQDQGQQVYQAALKLFNIADDRRGVPTMLLGETVMVGSAEIPEKLPALIEAGLASGGVPFPDIPGLLAAADPTPVPQTTSVAPVQSQPVFIQRFLRDPVANSIAVAVLVGMLGSLVALAYRFINPSEAPAVSRSNNKPPSDWRRWAIPLLCLLGLGVAGYLSFIELFHTQAVCGPLGNCNSVQTSKYATLWGVLPVGIFGIAGYLSIALAFLVQSLSSAPIKSYARLAMWAMALLGVLFSIYLTFLEPFVIGATCAWCISSAILITLLLWVTTDPAIQASIEISDSTE
jgi:uncharacterized membrane protein